MRWKVAGLSEADARPRALPSALTAAGVVQHLVDVERSWFVETMTGGRVQSAWRGDDPEAVWRVGAELNVEDLLGEYDATCARCRDAVAGMSLDAKGRLDSQSMTLRWVYLHMIEETARHNGHLDLLREALDGETGE